MIQESNSYRSSGGCLFVCPGVRVRVPLDAPSGHLIVQQQGLTHQLLTSAWDPVTPPHSHPPHPSLTPSLTKSLTKTKTQLYVCRVVYRYDDDG